MGVRDNNGNFYHYLPTNANVVDVVVLLLLLLPSHMIRVLFYKSMQIFAVGSGHLYFSLERRQALALSTIWLLLLLLFLSLPSSFSIYYQLLPSRNGWFHFFWFRIKLIFQCSAALRFFHFGITNSIANVSIWKMFVTRKTAVTPNTIILYAG